MQKRMPDHELPLQVQCEQCGRTAGAAIVQCPLRSEGNCRYQLSREWELSIRMRIAGGCVIVVAVVAVICRAWRLGFF